MPTKSQSNAICLVDDDESVRRAFRFLLRTNGFEVIDYASPIGLLNSGQFDNISCFVLDMHMPALSGLELLKVLRERDINTPIIFVTGRDDVLLRARAQAAGAIAFLAKPVESDQLISAICRATGTNRTRH